VIKTFFDVMRFFVLSLYHLLNHLQRVGPHNHGPLKTTCHRLRKRSPGMKTPHPFE